MLKFSNIRKQLCLATQLLHLSFKKPTRHWMSTHSKQNNYPGWLAAPAGWYIGINSENKIWRSARIQGMIRSNLWRLVRRLLGIGTRQTGYLQQRTYRMARGKRHGKHPNQQRPIEERLASTQVIKAWKVTLYLDK